MIKSLYNFHSLSTKHFNIIIYTGYTFNVYCTRMTVTYFFLHNLIFFSTQFHWCYTIILGHINYWGIRINFGVRSNLPHYLRLELHILTSLLDDCVYYVFRYYFGSYVVGKKYLKIRSVVYLVKFLDSWVGLVYTLHNLIYHCC